MKRNRIAILAVAVLMAALALTGCKKNEQGGAQAPSMAASGVVGNISAFYLELNGGEKSVDVTGKDHGKEVRAVLNSLKPSDAKESPENEELSIYIEWTADEDSYYAFVYKLGDGTSLVEMQAANADTPTFYSGEKTYDELEAIINSVAK